MASSVQYILAMIVVASVQILLTLAQTSVPFQTTNGYNINARLFNVSKDTYYMYGALEVSRNGTDWGYICDKQFTFTAAKVVCKMFNYKYGDGIAGGILGRSNNVMFPDKFICDGNETSLSACRLTAPYSSCNVTAGVMCFNETDKVFQMRVAETEKSSVMIKGRLEVRLYPLLDWGSVCDDGFTLSAAQAACKYMGYKFGEEVRYQGSEWVFTDSGIFGSSNQTNLDEVLCLAGQSFPSCDHNIWGNHNCLKSEDVGVICTNTTVRLISAVKKDYHIGSVEMYDTKRRGWFEVCDTNWNDADAQVVCKELGFPDGKALSHSALGPVSYGSVTALGSVTNVSCTGRENDLASCPKNITTLCGFKNNVINAASVICYETPVTEADLTDKVRIASTPGTSADVGYLEIQHMGVWGRVCEDTGTFEVPPISDTEATVACRMIGNGYIGGKRIGKIDITKEEYHIWLRGISCNGTESSIADCKIPEWGLPGQTSCRAPVRIACYHQEITLTIRDGNNQTGLLYFTHDSAEMEICASNWADIEANAACLVLGFNGGRAWMKDDYNTNIESSSILGQVTCTSVDMKFFNCIKDQWGVSKTQCNSGPAGVSCFNKVKMDPGNGGAGILQIFDNRTKMWSPICFQGFNDVDATVACRELGYSQGTQLPFEAFGYYSVPPQRSDVNCNGSESSVLDCPYKSSNANCTINNYASISCYDTVPNGTLKLENGNVTSAEGYGVLRIFQNNTWGYACDDVFADIDAAAYCSKVGQALGYRYSDGMKLTPLKNVPGPYFVTLANCRQSAGSGYECSPSYSRCYSRKVVSLVCAESSAPKLQMLDDVVGMQSGQLILNINDRRGVICANGWTDKNAQVACRQLNADYVAGIAKVYNRTASEMYLSGVKCYGYEGNLFQCPNDGWKKINTTACGPNSKEAGVICYKKLFLKDQIVTPDSVSGRLSMVLSRVIRDVCFDVYFTFSLAQLACQELGFENAAILKPAAPDNTNVYSMVKRLSCLPSHTSLTSCDYGTGGCSDGQVRLLCYNSPKNDVMGWNIIGNTGDIGQLRINMFDKYTGVVCPDGFLDNHANTTCSTLRQMHGVVLGSPTFPSDESEIVWFGNITCSSSSGSRRSCAFNKNVSRECFSRSSSVGLICFRNKDDFGIRLMDHESEMKIAGRVEIFVNGVWGTVCNKNANALSASIFCQQKGFLDGSTVADIPKRYGDTTAPIYLKNVNCTSKDKLFLGCANDGWKQVSNCTHDDDLEVMCFSRERFYPDPERHYGAVSVMNRGVYQLVCSDNFTDTEASTFCRSLGYLKGKSICCSAFDEPGMRIGLSRVRCQGNENSLLECSNTLSGSSYFCPSQQFASAVCFNEVNNDFSVTVENGNNGRLIITHYNANGTVCADNFHNQDAQVACRQAGFSTGLAFSAQLQPGTYLMSWASNLQCQGSESSLKDCPKFSLGNTGYCTSVASVVCLRSNDDSEIRLRLANGTSNYLGRVEVQINGTWGAICFDGMMRESSFAAKVICKDLGFRDGQFLAAGSFGPSSGPTWLQSVNCNGSESKLKECQLERAGEQPDCSSHLYDTVVECFVTARLIGGPREDHSRGQLQIYNKDNNLWQYVCDTGLTDREATLVCKGLDYQFGMQQCCSAAGLGISSGSFITSISCPASATDINNCTFVTNGECTSQHYAYVHCSHSAFTNENLTTTLLAKFIDIPTVKRFGVTGNVCNERLTDKEASVMCREVGYFSGMLLQPVYLQSGSVIMLKGLNCTGSEARIRDCYYPSLSQAGACTDGRIARILCLQTNRPVNFTISTDASLNSGRAEIHIDGRTMVVEDNGIDTSEASVFCRSVSNKKYVYGEVYLHPQIGRDENLEVLMSNVHCLGHEKNILLCDAEFLPTGTEDPIAYVECYNGAELKNGPTNVKSAGVLALYNTTHQESGAVCSTNFGQNEADVGCRMLGYEHGISHCCLPFGYNYMNIMFREFQCNGTESSLFDCKYEATSGYTSFNFCNTRQMYVGLTCYNGTKPNNFSIAISNTSSNTNSGYVQLNYLGTPGSICSDGWNNKDAQVVCRELNYANGIAYFHFRTTFSITDNVGPFWISNVNCTGSEAHIRDCPHSELGNLTGCDKAHHAGVLCTDGSEMQFRLAGTDKPHYGRVEVKINDVWGTVCDRYWDQRDASVMCRQVGYETGDVWITSDLPPGQGPVYEIGPRCLGTEDNINNCPHEGWTSDTTSSCSQHSRDAGVFCYMSVRLGTGTGKEYSHGPVNVFENGVWYKVCSAGFTDKSARIVCQELGFYDGRSVCCSAYDGEGTSFETLHPNITVQCAGDEVNVKQCIRIEQCQTNAYASVACFEQEAVINETDYVFVMNKDFETAGRIDVTHLGIKGRICSNNWTDIDARVFCKEMNQTDGLAYYHSYNNSYVTESMLGPYWISDVSCIGNETSLSQCKFNDRQNLGNCSEAHTAAAVCFNDTGINYRLSGGSNFGRIEMAIDGLWGTVCGQTFDNRDARVACRNLNFTDGEIEAENKYGGGSGPVWLRDIQCTGNEMALHACPHTGFNNDVLYENLFFPWLYSTCAGHQSDASVFCFKEAKLKQKLGMNSGPLLYSQSGEWVHVCDTDTFGRAEAKVACKSLLQSYKDGVPIRGGLFGATDIPVKVNSVQCTGNESTLSQCRLSTTGVCTSKTYISVVCYNNTLTDEDFKFQVRLSEDNIRTGDNHGILEIRQNGVWGRICMKGFTKNEATVACRELGGFKGGVTYLHLFRNRLPILWSSVKCNGDELSLRNCTFSTDVDSQNCPYLSNDAGVLCYKTEEGVQYRLQGGNNTSSGRVEIGIDGNYSSVCTINWNAANSRVLCKYLGYIDGIPSNVRNYSLESLRPLMSFFLCEGNETDLFTCMNSGFDYGQRNFFCGGDAYTACFEEEVKITNMRLGDGARSQGRVEVYVTGLNQWGTVCDDEWDNLDAHVFCKYLGFDTGVATSGSYKEGSGYIVLDNVVCNGTEYLLSECKHQGINYHNCDHAEDAGVRCFNNSVTVVTSATTTAMIPVPTTSAESVRTTTSTAATPKMTTIPTSIPTSTLTSIPTSIPTSTPTSARTDTTKTTTIIISTTATTEKSIPRTTANTITNTSTPDLSEHNAHSQDDSRSTGVIVGACVAVLIAIALIAVVFFLFYKYRVNPIPHKRFHDDDVLSSDNGSLAVSNRVFDISNPEGGNPIADGSEIHLDRAGYVTFSKGSELQPNTEAGFANPLYAVMRDPQDLDTESTT